jgi:hypothetical protein
MNSRDKLAATVWVCMAAVAITLIVCIAICSK